MKLETREKVKVKGRPMARLRLVDQRGQSGKWVTVIQPDKRTKEYETE